MDITCISDMHGFHPTLHGGDLLIVAGDMTASDKVNEWKKFYEWLHAQDYEKKIIIGGNHDNLLECHMTKEESLEVGLYEDIGYEYLCDSGTEFEGLKIWGSPWSLTFPGINPKCTAFTCKTEKEISKKFDRIPEEIDILITHCPPRGILDKNVKGEKCGSQNLQSQIGRIQPILGVFGHVHESYGELKGYFLDDIQMHFVNCSHVNEKYHPVNEPIRVVLS